MIEQLRELQIHANACQELQRMAKRLTENLIENEVRQEYYDEDLIEEYRIIMSRIESTEKELEEIRIIIKELI